MVNCFILLFYIGCARIVDGFSSIGSSDSPEDALNYIDTVQKELNVTQNSNIILVIGNTGCGKSTLVHYVAGDYSQMFSIEPRNPNSVNFEIRDELDPDRDRISLPTESRTLIPVISTDENQNVWVDSPGFGDTRNETVEIATAFLIKRVIENASNIKVVLVVNYNSVTKTNSRDDFDNLLSRATQLMKNVEQFENSVSLVVTKTPTFKIRARRYIDIIDDNVKNTTAHFMIDHRSVLETKGSASSKIRLIDALLEQRPPTNTYYPKISIFWRPNDSGPFNKIEKMVTGRRNIRESIFNYSSYAPVKLTAFGFPLTPQAQIKVRNMVQHTVDSIETTLQHSVDGLIIEIQRQIQLAKTGKSRLEFINAGLTFIQMENNGSKTLTLDQLVDQLARLIQVYNVSAADVKGLHPILQQGKNLLILNSLIAAEDENSSQNTINLDYYSYVEQVNEYLFHKDDEIRNGMANKAQQMTQHISKILANSDRQLLHALRKRIESIDGFHNKLKILQKAKNSIQSTQKEISLKERIDQLKNLTYALEMPSINVSALNHLNRYEKSLNELKSLVGAELPVRDWIATSSNAIDYQVSTYDWYSFLDETYRFFGEEDIPNKDHQHPSVNETNFGAITKRIRRNADFESSSSKINEINKIINITMKSPPTYHCDGKSLTIEGRFIRSSDIQDALVTKCLTLQDLTMVTVFVLDTLYVDSDLYLNKTKEVELLIMAPKWIIQKRATFHLNGVNGESYTKSADEESGGMHGEPGLNGGNFFGWANVIINSDLLSVDVSGGRGANGQNGTGSPDYAPKFDLIQHSDSGAVGRRGTLTEYYERYLQRLGYKFQLINTTGDITSEYIFNVVVNATHIFALIPDTCCGQTGAGGKGGFGGAGGSACFIHSSDTEKILPKIVSSSGARGDDGMDGRHCDTSELVLSIITEADDNIFRYNLKSKFYSKQLRHHDICPINRGLAFHAETPELARERLHGPINFVPSLIKYNLYLLKHMNDSEDNVAQSTYEAIKADPTINSAYKIKDLAMEANSLEQNYFELRKSIDVLPLYDNLLKKIKHFAAENEVKLSPDDRNVLALIYTTISSKTTGMRSSHKSDLIINIGGFIDLTAQNVKKLKEFKRIDVIREQLKEYNTGLEDKILEAKNLIEKDIHLELKRTIPVVNEQLRRAANETIKLQRRTLNELTVKEDQLRTMRRNLIMRNILRILECTGEAAALICKSLTKQISAVVLKFGAQIIENDLLVDPKIADKLEFPQSVERLRNTMHQNEREKISVTEGELIKLKKSLQDCNAPNCVYTDTLNEFIANANAIKLSDSVAIVEVNNFIEKCIEFLRGWHDVATTEREVSILRPIERAQHALTVIATSFPTYEEIWSDDDKISEVVQALNEDSETLKVLQRFEEGIYFELMPMVDEMYAYVMNVKADLVNKSSVALDVTKWKVKQTIRNVQNKLKDGLSQFDVEVNINECMTRINEAMELLIDIYNRIQSYEEDSKLAKYLTELHITSDSDSHDPELNEILNKMKMNSQVNLILGQYFRALGAFKQTFFPFAADYLDAYELPSSLVLANSSITIAHVSQLIESLSEKMKEYNDTVINEHDEHIHSAPFDRGSGSWGPFYVWPNFEIRDRIPQLFTGEKIYLFADVRKSDSTRNAVKFNRIELGFHSDNVTVNHNLHEILQSFHVSLTHMGSSNYRCDNTFYTIPSRRPFTIKYSIAERHERPADENLVHGKLSSGPSFMSPYTLWSVQLLPGRLSRFTQLEPFIDFIDLELHGSGLYVEENTAICETNLEKYYLVMGKIL